MAKSHAAGWASDAPTPAQLKEFFAQIESGSITKGYLQLFLRGGAGFFKETESQLRAHKIMGRNFFSIGMVVKCFSIRFSVEDLMALARVPFSEDVLTQCKDTHMLFPGYPLTVANMSEYSLIRSSFEGTDEEPFFTSERVDLRWYLVRKDPVPGSTDKNWQEQTALLTEQEVVPRLSEAIYSTVLLQKIAHIPLRQMVCMRCSDLSSDGERPWFYIDRRGVIIIDSNAENEHFSDLGLAAARNP